MGQGLFTGITDPIVAAMGGWNPAVFTMNKFGRNAASAAGDAIWVNSGAMHSVDEIAPGTVIIKSDDTDDDDPAGTGARTVRVFGLDAHKNLQTVDVILDGTTNVVPANLWSRIFRMRVLTAGSQDENDGKITAVVDSLELAQIAATRNQTEQAWYTIPAGYSGFLSRARASVGTVTSAAAFEIDLVRTVSEDSNVVAPICTIAIKAVGSSYVEASFDPPIKIDEKIDVYMLLRAVSGGTPEIMASFDLTCVRNDYRN